MTDQQVFLPPKTTGVILHALLILVLVGGCVALLIMAFSASVGGFLPLYLLGTIALLALLPIAVYRGYALLHARYEVERDGLRVRWGLRSEDVPLTNVTWVRPAADLVTPLQLPLFSIPGAILGATMHSELGHMEFMASSAKNLVIIATIEKTFVVSPEDPQDFSRRFQRLIEMGSLSAIEPHTALPAVFLRDVLADRAARVLIPLLVSSMAFLMILSSVLVPSLEGTPLGLDSSGAPLSSDIARRLLLLPVMSVFFTLADLVVGSFFYRREENRMAAYLLWGAGALTSILMLIAVVILYFTSR